MQQEEKLLKIKFEYCLKTIFSYIDYNYILKLIKNSKKFQRKLGINFQNYKKKSSYKYIERKIIKRNLKYEYDDEEIFKYICSCFFSSIIFLFVLIYAIILFAKGGFDDNNTKSNYNIKYFNIIKKINKSLFGFLGYIIASYFIIFVLILHKCYYDDDIKLILKKCSLILTAFIYLIYDACIIIKLYLSYKIKKNKITWFMICDYFLIILIFLYLVFISLSIYLYFTIGGHGIGIIKKYILKKFQNIDIEDYELPKNFKEINDEEKRLYIITNRNNYKIKFSNYNIFELINDFRKKNNIDELILDEAEYESFSNLNINKNSEIILFKYKTIYQLSKWEYLFVNQENEFEKNFENKNKDLINILLIKDLNKIQIFKKDNKEFIYIFKKNDCPRVNHEEIFTNRRLSSEQHSINIHYRERWITFSNEDIYYGDSIS